MKDLIEGISPISSDEFILLHHSVRGVHGKIKHSQHQGKNKVSNPPDSMVTKFLLLAHVIRLEFRQFKNEMRRDKVQPGFSNGPLQGLSGLDLISSVKVQNQDKKSRWQPYVKLFRH